MMKSWKLSKQSDVIVCDENDSPVIAIINTPYPSKERNKRTNLMISSPVMFNKLVEILDWYDDNSGSVDIKDQKLFREVETIISTINRDEIIQ